MAKRSRARFWARWGIGLKDSSEFQLLLACLRWPLAEADRDAIRARLEPAPRADEFLKLVRRHQVAPLVHRNLDDAARDIVAPEILAPLHAAALTASKKSFRRAMETIRIVAELRRAGIEARVLKGVALSIHAYGEATLQDSVDIDLLVPAAQVSEGEAILTRDGYRRIEPAGRLTPRRQRWILTHAHHFGFVHSQSREKVELHWGLTPNPYKHPAFRVEATPTAMLAAGSHRIPSLTPEDMFLHACVHGAQHYWHRLKWLAQVAAILTAMAAAQFDAMAARAAAFGVTAEVAAALALARHYGLAGSREIKLAREAATTRDRIVAHSIAAIERDREDLNQHAPAGFRDEWRAGRSFGYRRNLIERTIIREDSFGLIDLPDRLFFLYALMAPLALIKYGKRMRARRERVGAKHTAARLDPHRPVAAPSISKSL
jgi:hypothetical protein